LNLWLAVKDQKQTPKHEEIFNNIEAIGNQCILFVCLPNNDRNYFLHNVRLKIKLEPNVWNRGGKIPKLQFCDFKKDLITFL
jgi:hypothetical protein